MTDAHATYYVVTRAPGERWDAARAMREQEGWDEHAAFMDNLVEEGTIVVAGPLDGGPKVLLIFAAESEDEIETRLAQDPWTRSGQLTTDSIVPWELRLGRDVFSRTAGAKH